jgi:hypothetical protein
VTHRARRGRAVSRASSPKPQFVPAAARARARGAPLAMSCAGWGGGVTAAGEKGFGGRRGSCGGARPRPRPRGGIRDSEGASAEPRHLFLDGGGERDAGCEHRFRWHVFRPLAAQPPSPAESRLPPQPPFTPSSTPTHPPTASLENTDSLPGEHRQPPWRTNPHSPNAVATTDRRPPRSRCSQR